MSLWASIAALTDSWNHRIVEVGKDHLRSSSPTPMLNAQSDRTGCPGPWPWPWVLDISTDGDSTIFLGNLFPCLNTLIGKKKKNVFLCSDEIACVLACAFYLLCCQWALLRRIRLPLNRYLHSLPSSCPWASCSPGWGVPALSLSSWGTFQSHNHLCGPELACSSISLFFLYWGTQNWTQVMWPHHCWVERRISLI